jgi:hypothetical protein
VRLSSAQTVAQATFWLIMLILGVVIVDVDDQSHEESILINIFGWSPELLDITLELEKVLAFSAIWRARRQGRTSTRQSLATCSTRRLS